MFDQFGNIRADDEQARLDHFATELKTRPESKGVIVGYRSSTLPRGQFLRMLWGYADYLVNSLGIASDRFTISEGGFRNSESIELWIVPGKARPPSVSWKPTRVDRLPVLFDRFSTTDIGDCVGEYSIYLYKTDDALRFFAEALQTDPDAKAAIVIHPGYGESRAKISSIAQNSRESVISAGISPQRVLTAVGKRYSPNCTSLNLWLAPRSSLKADETAFYGALMKNAEAKEYTVRRVEFTGNSHIRDGTLRRRFRQQEGDLFSIKLLSESLKNFGRLRFLYPVTFDDVVVSLADEDRLLDITIAFKEKPRSRQKATK